METPKVLHLLTKIMIRLTILCLTSLILTSACGQNNSNPKAAQNDSMQKANLKIDTAKVAILNFDTGDKWLFKNARPTTLTNDDIMMIDKVLQKCICEHNKSIDTTRSSYYFINLIRYKRQYVPFIDKGGLKKVWINCFCANFDYWRKQIVQVEDGGSCFFNLLINLTDRTFSNFIINGLG